MTVIFEDLYQKVISDQINHYKQIKIAVGYASSTFLEKVHKDFPALDIELYIGMALDGISNSDHAKYVELTNSDKNINVYYHNVNPKNHMKIYSFIGDKIKTYIGSANFSTVAFNTQQEIMVETYEDVSTVFDQIEMNTVLCTNSVIVDQMIPFYDVQEFEELNNSALTPIKNTDTPKKNSATTESRSRSNVWSKKFLTQKIDGTMYDELEINLVLPKERDPLWDVQGINNQDKPHLKATPGMNLKKFFCNNIKFKIYTEQREYMAYLDGAFDKEIHFKRLNIYQYIRKEIGLVDERPISFKDLESFGAIKMKFIRLNEVEYFMEFKNGREG